MLWLVEPKVSKRKLRLFACACCRNLWPAFADERSQGAIETSEKYADGLVKRKELDASRARAKEVGVINSAESPIEFVASSVARPQLALGFILFLIDRVAVRLGRTANEEQAHQAAILRDLFGNPLIPQVCSQAWSSWRSGMIPQLAQAIYTDRAFDRLPLLADALEDAGCTDAAILEHCRGPGPHVRGCWVVDLLLCKE
jgi:hypothetical protein